MSWWQTAVRWMLATDLTATDQRLYDALGSVTAHTDEVVTHTSVMGLSAAWACVSLLSGTISSLSLNVQRSYGSVRVTAPEHPLQSVLDDPNGDQTPIDFWEFMVLSLELWGNAYAEIERRWDGSIIALTPIRPDSMTVERSSSGAIRYRWYADGQTHDRFEDGVFHIRGRGGDPLGGMSTIAWHKNAFGNAQAIERSAGKTFANGITPSVIISADKPLTKVQMEEAEKLISSKYAGAVNAGRPMLLNNGMEAKQISFKPQDAQMLESRGFSVEEICRIFDVPPFMVGHTEKVTSFGSGLEQQILGFQKFALRKRLKKIEQAVRKQLMTPQDRSEGYSVSFNLEDLLRGDSKARSAFYKVMLETKVYTINEVRALEGKPPVEWGDEPWVQMQDRQVSDRLEDDDERTDALEDKE
ncbi:phage portal protein [Sphingobium yanoikuyae]|jgi:HK97 family phage portal protein|uniref:phage portal protein n=1 Tax=Sphingobium yanoikuyae TaxID=13690 RepID=UPI003B8FFE45